MKLKLREVKVGQKVSLDNGFYCMFEGVHTVKQTESGKLYLSCAFGKHFLDGQEDENGYLVGIYSYYGD